MDQYKKVQFSDDLLALHVSQKLNHVGVTENAILPDEWGEDYQPRTLIDQTLEFIDPTPNIHTLFVQFNARYFWNTLLPVEVKWSTRMTSCAGVCYFHPRNRQCVISLSAPLLKLRPRKDVVETLLHEMIHGYLFLTNDNRDRDGHGPEFCKHMRRINQEAGTKITVYHNFHDEVRLYQQHWWRCDGPCQNRAPYFGTVRRAMNRAPGPSDFWWKDHQRTCSGRFVKIKEPEKVKGKSEHSKSNITNWLEKPHASKSVTQKTAFHDKKPVNELNTYKNSVIKKDDNAANLIHSWSTRSPEALEASMASKLLFNKSQEDYPKNPKFTLSGKLGGSNTGRSNLLDRFPLNKSSNNKAHRSMQLTNPNTKGQQVRCLICNSFTSGSMTIHLGKCPINSKQTQLNTVSNTPNLLIDTMSPCSSSKGKLQQVHSPERQTSLDEVSQIVSDKPDRTLAKCPICNNLISGNLNIHLDNCLRTSIQTETVLNDKCTPILLTNSTSCKKSQKRKLQEVDSPEKQASLKEVFCVSSDKLDENLDKQMNKVLNKTLNMKCDETLNKTLDKKLANCPVCNDRFPFDEINNHLDKCLSNETCSNVDNTIILDTSSDSDVGSPITDRVRSSRSVDLNSESYKCLVCNALIADKYSLSDHLEECIGNVFNDDSTEVPVMEEEISEVKEDRNEYPCPVCMTLVLEQHMNQHLDLCLKLDVDVK